MRLNLGCGQDIKDGYVNVDHLDLPGVDVVHSLLRMPWPFEDGSAEEILALDVVEHLPSHTPDLYEPTIVKFVEECHRILQPGGELFIRTPGHDADFLWIDPTHVRGFAMESFDFWDDSTAFGQSTGFYSECRFKVKASKLPNKNLEFSMRKV